MKVLALHLAAAAAALLIGSPASAIGERQLTSSSRTYGVGIKKSQVPDIESLVGLLSGLGWSYEASNRCGVHAEFRGISAPGSDHLPRPSEPVHLTASMVVRAYERVSWPSCPAGAETCPDGPLTRECSTPEEQATAIEEAIDANWKSRPFFDVREQIPQPARAGVRVGN